ncbi:hypothetical protein EVAR_38946_1 [Eumeta japonica]|uniref:Uncharacterized protein n=1 Tax=Eumeta variegata TaxID=151549 RepID=A0A4C1WB24_EUMVA|nr:hypothetical protein EVAR_38946_1 [Eumeta japonica]
MPPPSYGPGWTVAFEAPPSAAYVCDRAAWTAGGLHRRSSSVHVVAEEHCERFRIRLERSSVRERQYHQQSKQSTLKISKDLHQ